MNDANPPSPATVDRPALRRVAGSVLVGTTIEWYDFQIYGASAALVFAPLFFSDADPALATILSFATFAVGFLARPLGGVVMGHFGDRIGRKKVLVLALLLMGAATFLVGVLPTSAQIGVWAPILLVLLRLIQGFGVGGEWGGAVLTAVEYAPKNRRGFYGSMPQVGVPCWPSAGDGRHVRHQGAHRGPIPGVGVENSLPAEYRVGRRWALHLAPRWKRLPHSLA